MPQILVISSTKKHVSDPVYVYNGSGEGETLYGVSLTLNLTAPATVRLTVSSRQNDTVSLVKDFGYVSYPAGNSVLNVGNALGVIGVNLQFQDVSKFVSVSEGFKSSYELNQAYATVYLNTSDVPGSPSNPFASTAERDAWLGTLLPGRSTAWAMPGPVEYKFVGPGATAWTPMLSARVNSVIETASQFCAPNIRSRVPALTDDPSSDAPTITVAVDGSAWPNSISVDSATFRFSETNRTPAFASLQNKVPSSSELLPTLYSFEIDAPFQAIFYGDGDVLRMWVDGKRVYSTTVLTDNAFTRLDMSWTTYRRRKISFIAQQFAGLRVSVHPDSVSPSPLNLSGSLVVIGDSWTVGGINMSKMSELWPQYLAIQKGFKKYYAAGVSGTGFAKDTVGPIYGDVTRWNANVAYTPSDSYVIINGSINDAGLTQSAMEAGIASVFDKISAKFTPSRVLVVGPQFISTVSSASNSANEALIFAAAQERGFNTVSTLGWLTGTGRSGATTGAGNQDRYLGSDGEHLTPLGCQYWASKISAAMDAVPSMR